MIDSVVLKIVSKGRVVEEHQGSPSEMRETLDEITLRKAVEDGVELYWPLINCEACGGAHRHALAFKKQYGSITKHVYACRDCGKKRFYGFE